MTQDLTMGNLFAGIGGFELGGEMAGCTTIWNCEIEERQRRVLKKHFPNAIQYEDIKNLKNPPYVDIITGGFPCQDISISNVSNRKLWDNGKIIGINGERSGLWSEMHRLIDEVRPKYAILENSPMLINRGLDRVLSDLFKSGIAWNGNVYTQRNLDTLTTDKDFTVLPTPCKKDSSAIMKSLNAFINYYKAKHQDKLLYQCQLNGLTPAQTIEMYECVMGFPKDWTKVE